MRLEHDLEFDTVRIGKEDRVVARRVAILGRRIENRRTDLDEEGVEPIDLRAAVGVEGEVMEARRIAIVRGRLALARAIVKAPPEASEIAQQGAPAPTPSMRR
jgi:hypothetical protein